MSDLEIDSATPVTIDDVEDVEEMRLMLYGARDVQQIVDEWLTPESTGNTVQTIGMIPVRRNDSNSGNPTSTGFRRLLQGDPLHPRPVTVNLNAADRDALSQMAENTNPYAQMNPNKIIEAVGTATTTYELVLLNTVVNSRVRASGIHPSDPYAAPKLYLLRSPFWILFLKRMPIVAQYAFSAFLGRTETMKKIRKFEGQPPRERRGSFDEARPTEGSPMETIDKLFTPRAGYFAPAKAKMPPGTLMYEYEVGRYAFYGKEKSRSDEKKKSPTKQGSKKHSEKKKDGPNPVLIYYAIYGVDENGKPWIVKFFITRNLGEWTQKLIRPMADVFANINMKIEFSRLGMSSSMYPPIDARHDIVERMSPSSYFNVVHVSDIIFDIANGTREVSAIMLLKDLILYSGNQFGYFDTLAKFREAAKHLLLTK